MSKESVKAWKAANRERVAAVQRAYRVNNAARIAVKEKEWRHANKERMAKWRREYTRSSLTGGMRRADLEELDGRTCTALARNELWSAANAVVSKGLPRDDRSDIIQELVLAMLEGRASAVTLRNEARLATTKHYREFHHHSLDAVMPGYETMRLMDTIAADAEHF